MAAIEHIQYVNAPASAVYAALTTEKGLANVWTDDLTVEAALGAVNTFGFGEETPTRMKITELAENTRLVWHCVESDPEWVGTDVRFDLAEENGTTSVVLRHLHWREVTTFYRWCNYNWAMFLYSLKQYCEQGEGRPYQQRTF